MSRARSSTLRHLKRLAATTAVSVACSGYETVDPVPPPACARSDVQRGTAVWKVGGDSSVGLQLVVTILSANPADTLELDPSSHPANAAIVGHSVDASGNLTIVVEIAKNLTQVTLGFIVNCGGPKDFRYANIQWTADPVAGRAETVTIF